MKKKRCEEIPHFSYVLGISLNYSFILQLLMCWLLLDIDLSIKVKQENVAKVVGVANQVSCRGRT